VVDPTTGTSYRRIKIRDAIGSLTALSITSLVANPPAPQQVGTQIAFTANTVGGVGTLRYKWWLFDGMTWAVVQDWSPSSTFVWTPRTVNASYQVGVWVQSGTIPGDTFDRVESTLSIPFSITPSTLTVNLVSTTSPPQPPGTPIVFTAAATGGIAPYQYRWW